MQVLQSGQHKWIFLELEGELVSNIAKREGFDAKLKDSSRNMVLELTAQGRQAPLLLFDASDPANLGWFSRCTFYVDGRSGAVMQTPMTVGNKRDRGGKARMKFRPPDHPGELPASFRRRKVAHRTGFHHLLTVLQARQERRSAVVALAQPLAGRTESAGRETNGGAAPASALRSAAQLSCTVRKRTAVQPLPHGRGLRTDANTSSAS
jgi:hypothetical protein